LKGGGLNLGIQMEKIQTRLNDMIDITDIKDLKDMKINDSFNIIDEDMCIKVVRVFNGWIYTFTNVLESIHTQFIPY